MEPSYQIVGVIGKSNFTRNKNTTNKAEAIADAKYLSKKHKTVYFVREIKTEIIFKTTSRHWTD